MSRAEVLGWTVGVVGLVLAGLGWWLEPRDFAFGWLAALVFWIGWPLGAMALILVHALTGGRWGEAVRPGLLLGVLTLVLLIPALIPYAFTATLLYPWLHTPELANHFYLNLPFFELRAVIDICVWLGLGALVLRGGNLYRLAPPGLIVLALTVTFAGIDAVLSLDPRFASSEFGMITAAAMALLALSVALLFAAFLAPEEVLMDLGKLLLGILVLWAYLEFMQMLIVWESNLAADAPWYARRMHGGWGATLAVLAIGHFLLPFAALIFPRMQRNRFALALVSLLLIVMAMLRCWWLVLPESGRSIDWIDGACMAALGGIALGVALRSARLPFVVRLAQRHV